MRVHRIHVHYKKILFLHIFEYLHYSPAVGRPLVVIYLLRLGVSVPPFLLNLLVDHVLFEKSLNEEIPPQARCSIPLSDLLYRVGHAYLLCNSD